MAARLSLIVITKNAAATLPRCLGSVPFADRIVVVDCGSSDATAALARAAGADVIVTPDWPGFGPQKNRALAAATGDWILSLDADEWLEPPLAELIARTIAAADAADAYEMPRRSRFCGTVVNHCGWSPDYVLRLFRRGAGRFSDDIVHERVVVAGTPARLRLPIEHETIVSWDDALDKVQRYSEAAARQMAARGKRSSPAKASLRGWFAFLKTLVLRGGWRDGRTGLGVATYNRLYTDRKWRRLAEMTRKSNG